MERLRFPLAILSLTLALVASGCGSDDPDPDTVLDRALTRAHLSEFANGPEGPRGGVVAVQALGYEDRALDERRIQATPEIMGEIRDGLGGDSGLRGLVEDLELTGTGDVDGVAVDEVSGNLDVAGLAGALEQAGGGDVDQLAGVGSEASLSESLVGAEFDLYASREEGTIQQLDLTLSLDDPDNALPPVRIRFSLKPDPQS